MTSPILQQIPQPSDILATSQSELLGNFQYFQQALNRDHNISFGIDANTDQAQGLHNRVALIDTGNTNIPRPSSANSIIWATQKNLYWKCSGINGVQLTNANVGNPVAATQGISFLPGGLAIQWGQFTSNNSQPNTVTFLKTFSAASYCVQCTAIINSSLKTSVQVASISSASFTAYTFASSSSPAPNILFSWMAIGAL
jgi:hypothetical protein